MSRVAQWVRDWWRAALITIAAVLVGLLAVLVATSITDRENALQVAKDATTNQQAERAALNERIDSLLGQIRLLQADASANSARIARLVLDVQLLERQVRDLGGQPVVTSSNDGSGTTSSPSPHPSSTVRPTPISTPTPTHRPTPTPSPSLTFCIPLITC